MVGRRILSRKGMASANISDNSHLRAQGLSAYMHGERIAKMNRIWTLPCYPRIFLPSSRSTHTAYQDTLSSCHEAGAEARAFDHILNGTLLPEIAQTVLVCMAEGGGVDKIKVTTGKNGEFKYRIS